MSYEAQIKGIKEARNKNIDDARKIADRAIAENRDTTGPENEEMDKFHVAIERQDGQIRAYERLAQADASGDANEGRQAGRAELENRAKPGRRRGVALDTEDYRSAYHEYLVTGERRAMTMGNQPSGGYLYAPASVSAEIIKQVDNLVVIKKYAKKFPVTNTQATGVRRKTSRASDANWTPEIGDMGGEDTSLAFDRRDLTPNQITKLIKVSDRLMLTGPDAENEVNEEMAYKFGVTEENAFLNADGNAKPVGVFNTTSSAAIAANRDTVTGVVGGINGDDLINLKYGMKQGYMAEARWMFHRNVLRVIRQLKDGQGRYIWREGISSDKPDTILDQPFDISEYAPGTIASGSYVGILANWKYYGIAELLDMTIQRLNELYAANGEVGFKGKAWIDGQPLQDEAFGRLKVA